MRTTTCLLSLTAPAVSGSDLTIHGLHPHDRHYCARVCKTVKECRNDHHHGLSYCKYWQDPPVCFGLYHTRHHPHDEHEDNDEDNGARVDDFEYTEDGYDEGSNDGGEEGEVSQDEQFDESEEHPKVDEDDEYFEGDAEDSYADDNAGNNEVAAAAPPTTTIKYCYQPNDADCDDTILEAAECGGFATDAEADQACSQLCSSTEACAAAERPVSSFCMTWKEKPVCFGLYVKEKVSPKLVRFSHSQNGHGKPVHSKKLCYQPRDRHCHDRKLKPVRCGRHRPDHD
jgi:hypothetical protein